MKRHYLTLFLIVAAYVVVVVGVAAYLYGVNVPRTQADYEEYWKRVGIGMTAVSAFFTFIVSMLNQIAQIRSAEKLKIVESDLNKQKEFLTRNLDARTDAYNKLVVAANNLYRELQHLDSGKYDKEEVDSLLKSFHEAHGLIGHLDEEDRKLANGLLQTIFVIADSAEEVRGFKKQMQAQYKAIWSAHVKQFGDQFLTLQKRSPLLQENVRQATVH